MSYLNGFGTQPFGISLFGLGQRRITPTASARPRTTVTADQSRPRLSVTVTARES